jgi:periplasmic divalent cation tolerance protein
MLSAERIPGISDERWAMSDERWARADYVIVLTTLPADVDAAAIADALVGARLAACVNLLPIMQSTYRWQESIEHDSERQMVIKTSRSRVEGLWEKLRDLHPYDVPEFVVIPIVDGNEAYLNWIGETTT